MARVLTVDLNNEAIAYPYEVLRELNVINDTVATNPIAVFWAEGTASALDRRNIPEGRDIGAAVAYARMLDDRELTFEFSDGKIHDKQTGSA